MCLQRMDQNLALFYDFAKLWWDLYSSGNLFLNCGNRAITSNVKFLKKESTPWKYVFRVCKVFFFCKSIFFLDFPQGTLLKTKGLSVFSPSLPLFFQCLLVWNACNTWKSFTAGGAFCNPAILHLSSLFPSLISVTVAPWVELSYPSHL